MAAQNTRIRQRLGAELARVRHRAGYPTQSSFAEHAELGLRTIVAVERGEKVAAKTLRKIEIALRIPTGSTDDFLADQVQQLPEPADAPQPRGAREVERLLSMTHEELLRDAREVDQVAPGAGEDWLRTVLDIRKRAREMRQSSEEGAHDVTQRNL